MADELDPKAFYYWRVPEGPKGRLLKLGWRMKPAEALAQYPDAVPDLLSKEIRHNLGTAGDIFKTSPPVDGLTRRAPVPDSASPASALPPPASAPQKSKGE